MTYDLGDSLSERIQAQDQYDEGDEGQRLHSCLWYKKGQCAPELMYPYEESIDASCNENIAARRKDARDETIDLLQTKASGRKSGRTAAKFEDVGEKVQDA